MPSIKIDGRDVPFEPGDTVMRAAYRAGIEIPHYCWHPGLSSPANCRMCLVDILPPPGRPALRLDILEWSAEKNDYVVAQKSKLQPACYMQATDGMEVLSDTSDEVAKARAAIQELLLLNHPVDCPICDQAGECKLQDYWLLHQRSKKRMCDEPVHKPKAVVFGPTIVYDAERCVMCTRCIRVCDEVAQNPVLDMRERGNRNEITVAPGRQLDHGYSLMTEHVCPVGALTSSHFRFKARVWFLRSARTVCQECATGCNAHLDYDPRDNLPYRYRPRDNEAVNKYWMCDEGMLSYGRATAGRMLGAHVGGDDASIDEALHAAKDHLRGCDPARVAIVLSAQHSQEDNFALLTLGREYLGVTDVFVARRPDGLGDKVLRHVDKNPNGAGVKALVGGDGPRPLAELVAAAQKGRYSHVLALGHDVDVDVAALKSAFAGLTGSIVIASHDGPLTAALRVALPACAWTEAAGTYVNAQGMAQPTEQVLRPRGDARPGWELVARLGRALGFAIPWKTPKELARAMRGAAGSEPTHATAGAVAAEVAP
ncbi:MAG: (2Fe-2S)-binding protein [Myxococcales bacterium]|nr:(2Fe-2S)-binding protein [Myxococcales bacterium]